MDRQSITQVRAVALNNTSISMFRMFLVFGLLLLSAVPLISNAQSGATLSVDPASVSIAPGETVDVTIKIDTGSEVFGNGGYQLDYDETLVSVSNTTANPGGLANTFGFFNDSTAGTITFNLISTAGASGEIELLQVTLTGLAVGTSALTLTDREDVDTSIVNGQIIVNNAPTAVADSATVNEDSAVTIDVLGNDSDTDGDSLTIDSATSPANGTAVINSGQIDYTPNANFNGSDSFDYTISDGNGGTATATVTVTVDPVNDAPVAAADSATTNEDTLVSIDVLANDSDIDGDSLSIDSVTTPANGSAVINSGQIDYTPNADYNGSDSFDVTISDGNSGTDTATVTVTVNPVNDAPVAAADSATTDEEVAVTIDVLANDTDTENDSLTIDSVTTPANGSAVINNGQIDYTPATDFVGNDSFDVTISDGNGGTATATVSVTVNQVNDAPVAVADSATTDEEVTVTIDVLANDTDVENDSLTIDSVTDPTNGTAVINSGQIDYTPNADFNGSDSFNYTISDGNGGTATGSVSVTVNNVNDAPVAADDDLSGDEDTTITLDVLANDSDIDGDALTIESITQPDNGTATISGSEILFTPPSNWYGTTTLTYVANDGALSSNSATVTITVNSVADTGDVSCDNTVSTVDALFVLQFDVQLRSAGDTCPLGDSASELNISHCDVNDDQACTTVDALFILQCDVGLSNDFCLAD